MKRTPMKRTAMKRARPKRTPSAFSTKTRGIIRKRSDGICEICGGESTTQMHHIESRNAGGSDDASLDRAGNGLDLGNRCHPYVEANPELSYQYGWKVKRGMPHGPVLYRGRWVTLDDEGGRTKTSPPGPTATASGSPATQGAPCGPEPPP